MGKVNVGIKPTHHIMLNAYTLLLLQATKYAPESISKTPLDCRPKPEIIGTSKE